MSFQISPPEQFNIDQPENWAPWIHRFERYRLASKLNDESEKSQVNMLMNLLGNTADSILSSFRLSEEQSNSYDTVKQKFQDYFNVRHNVIYERAKFNLRKQEVGKTVDDFLTSLHTLVETCNYGNLRDLFKSQKLLFLFQKNHQNYLTGALGYCPCPQPPFFNAKNF